MVSPTVLPGDAFAEHLRRSTLLFHWRAQDLGLRTVDRSSTGTFTRASAGGLVNGRGQITDAADTDVRLVGPHADNQPRFGVSSAGVPHLLLEASRTNLCLRFSEFNNASWVKTTTTVATDSIAAPDALGAADTLTASAGNGTVIQDLGVIGSAARTFSIWLKRKTGTGNIQLTLDNGSAWTTKTITDEWARYSITQTLANPDVGIRIVTNADAVYAWGAQAEAGSFPSSPIPTVGSTATRAVETLSFPFTAARIAITVLTSFVEEGTILTDAARVFHIGSSGVSADPRMSVNVSIGFYRVVHDDGTTVVVSNMAVAPAIDDFVELRCVLFSDGAVQLHQTLNGGTEISGAKSAATTLTGNWADSLLWPNSAGTGFMGFIAFTSIKAETGEKTLAQMREAL